MRSSFKQLADIHGNAMHQYIGQVIDGVWEVMQICSQVTDRCLRIDGVAKDQELVSLILILRNMISDCCCCMDALERGHERTIFNNIRMILEDFGCVAHAKTDPEVLASLLAGKHQSSNSISFLKNNYPTHELHRTYGWLSKISHHRMVELIIRQWVDREQRLSHLKPFDPGQTQAKLDALLIIIHLVRLAGEEAESLCFNALHQSYFWIDKMHRNRDTPADRIITNITAIVENLMVEAEACD